LGTKKNWGTKKENWVRKKWVQKTFGYEKHLGTKNIWVQTNGYEKKLWVQWVHVKVLAWQTPDGEKTRHDTMSWL